MQIKCKVLVVRKDGTHWAGENSLEPAVDIDKAKVFTNTDVLLDRVRDIITLATSPVTQIRIVTADYEIP
jgi:hypothetical protein